MAQGAKQYLHHEWKSRWIVLRRCIDIQFKTFFTRNDGQSIEREQAFATNNPRDKHGGQVAEQKPLRVPLKKSAASLLLKGQ